MHCLAACEEAEHIINTAKNVPSRVPAPCQAHPLTQLGKNFDIRQLYEEECAKDLTKNDTPNLRSGSMLLEKLVVRHQLHTMVVKLHIESKGYSILIKSPDHRKSFIDTEAPGTSNNVNMCKEEGVDIDFMYSEDRFLRYIDNEELPVGIAETLVVNYSHMFYNGCIIAEIRDYRLYATSDICDTHYVLLKPNQRSILRDTNLIAAKHRLNERQRQQVEGSILANTVPLCLDPSPVNILVANKIHHERQLLNTLTLRKRANPFTQESSSTTKKLKSRHKPEEPCLKVDSFLNVIQPGSSIEYPETSSNYSYIRFPERIRIPEPIDNRIKPCLNIIDLLRDELRPVELFEKTIRDVDPKATKTRNFDELRHSRANYIKLRLFQKMSNFEYIGELYLDSDYRENQSKGSAYQFSLGPSKQHAYGYMKQFLDKFDEKKTPSFDKSMESTTQTSSEVPVSNVRIVRPNVPQRRFSQLTNGSSVVLVQGSQGIISATNATQINATNSARVQPQLQSNNRSHLKQTTIPITRTTIDPPQYQVTVSQTPAGTYTANLTNHATILSRLKSTPVNQFNSAESTAVGNAIINNSNIAIVNIPRNMTNQSRVQNSLNQIVANATGSATVNQPVQINLSQLRSQLTSANVNQGQTFKITSLNAGNLGFVPINNVTQQKSARMVGPSATAKRTTTTAAAAKSSDSRLHALLQDTSAADYQGESTANANSELFEHIATSPTMLPNSPSPKTPVHLVAHSPKVQQVTTPLSSPPPQVIGTTANNTIRSFNLAQLSNFPPGQWQISGLQPIQLPIAGGSHASVLVPIQTSGTTTNIMPNASVGGNTNATVLPFTIYAQNVNKGATRNATTQRVHTIQRTLPQNSTRALLTNQRTANNTAICIAAPGTNAANLQTINAANLGTNSILTLTNSSPQQIQQVQLTLQKQAQLQQRLHQQKAPVTPGAAIPTKFRRRSNATEPSK